MSFAEACHLAKILFPPQTSQEHPLSSWTMGHGASCNPRQSQAKTTLRTGAVLFKYKLKGFLPSRIPPGSGWSLYSVIENLFYSESRSTFSSLDFKIGDATPIQSNGNWVCPPARCKKTQTKPDKILEMQIFKILGIRPKRMVMPKGWEANR